MLDDSKKYGVFFFMDKRLLDLEKFQKRSALMSDVFSYTEGVKLDLKNDIKVLNSKLDDISSDYGKKEMLDKIKKVEYRLSMVENSVMKIIDYLHGIGYRF